MRKTLLALAAAATLAVSAGSPAYAGPRIYPGPGAIRTGQAMSMPRLDSRSPLLLAYRALLGRLYLARAHLRLIRVAARAGAVPVRRRSVPPETLEARRAQGRVALRVGDRDVPEPVRVRGRCSADGLTHPVLAVVLPV